MPNNTSRLPKKDPLAFTFLIAMALAAAVVTGASFSGFASGALQDLLRTARFGQDSEITAEQRRQALALEKQALALEKIEISIGRARADVALLNTRVDEAERVQQESVHLTSSIDREHELDLGGLRASLDEQTERHREELRAVNKRIDWLENIVLSHDATGATQPATPTRRQGVHAGSGRFVLHAQRGVAVIAGKGGALDVTSGSVIPDLGRVSAIRQEGGRWVVVTDKGVTVRGR